jgi:nucleoside-diphosphate-sugar epimerase
MAEYPAIGNQYQRVLVTGANGFIGSRLCSSLIGSGFSVIAGVRKSARLNFLEGLEVDYAYGDVTQPETLQELIQGADAVIHNAGLVKAKSKSQLFEVNTFGSEALIKACVESESVKRFIFVSSLAAYGPVVTGLRREEDNPKPITAYGRSKLEAEKLLLKHVERINLQFARPVGVYGPGDKEIFTFFQSVARGIRPAIGDTSRKIQLIYVEDLVEGVTKMLKHELPSGEGYFLAEQNASTFAELMEQMALACEKRAITLPIPGWFFRILGSLSEIACAVTPFTPILTSEKAREILSPWEISIERARKHFDFSPQTNFAEGAKKTVQWYRKHGWL